MKPIKFPIQLLLLLLLVAQFATAQQQLSLEEVLSLAKTNNKELKTSALEIEKASQQKVIARSLLLPTVTANAQANHFFQLQPFFGFGENNESGKIPYGRFGGKDQLAAFIAANQPLYNPSAYPTLQRAQLQYLYSNTAAHAKEVETLSEIKSTYLLLLVLQERIALKQESINRNKRVLQDARSLFLQGKGLRVDTLRAYTSVKNLEPDLVKLSYAAETGRLKLKTLIGLDSLGDFTLTDSLALPTPENITNERALFEEIKNSNPELQLLKLQEQIDKQQVKIASAYRQPVLSLVAQYQVQTQTNSMEYGNANYPTSSFVGLNIAVPIFTGLSNSARVKHASISKDQSTLRVQYRQQQLEATTHEAIANSKEALLRLETTAVVQETAKLSYTIIQYRYKSGISSRLELTDAELALSTAQSNYLEAVYDYLSADIALNKLKGSVE